MKGGFNKEEAVDLSYLRRLEVVYVAADVVAGNRHEEVSHQESSSSGVVCCCARLLKLTPRLFFFSPSKKKRKLGWNEDKRRGGGPCQLGLKSKLQRVLSLFPSDKVRCKRMNDRSRKGSRA